MGSKGKGAAIAVGAGGLVALALLTGKAKAAPEEAPKPKPKPLTEKQRAAAYALKYARAFGVPPSLVLALLAVGGWRSRGHIANVRGGSWGYSFMSLATAQDLTKRFPAIATKYWPNFARNQTTAALMDPAENIALGAYQMSLQWKRFREWYAAALSYYTGAGRMDSLIKQGGGKLPASLPADVAKQRAAYVRVRATDAYVKKALATPGVGDADPLVWTPSAARAEFNRIRIVLDAINADVSAAAKPPKKIISSDEWNRWRDFYLAAHKFVTTASDKWGSNVAKARQLEQDAVKWRELLRERGVKPSGPADLARKPDDSKWYESTAAKWGIGVAAVAAGAALVNAVKK